LLCDNAEQIKSFFEKALTSMYEYGILVKVKEEISPKGGLCPSVGRILTTAEAKEEEIKAMENDEFMVEVVDIDGEEFEKIAELEHEGEVYFALIPFVDDEDDDSDEIEIEEFGILKRVEVDGEFMLESVDDDDLHDKIGGLFEAMFEEAEVD